MPSPLIFKSFLFFIAGALLPQLLFSQTTDTISQALPGIEVRSLERRQRYIDAPLSIGLISSDEFNRHLPGSVVGAMNTVPGVKMEERSPGSYRLNIRGSSLRAPFGVRNVKVYLNGLPITDPGGQTYLSAFAPSLFRRVEIVRGPVSSIYGPGTGGAVTIESTSPIDSAGLDLKTFTGSYGLKSASLTTRLGTAEQRTVLLIDHLYSDGYRRQSFSRRNNFAALGNYQLNQRCILRPSLVYSELNYGTPGALNFSEYNSNPRFARPASGNLPGAEAAGASVNQQTLLAGILVQTNIHARWINRTSVYYMRTRLQNPTIRNYESSRAPHGGGRTVFVFRSAGWEWTSGMEWQEGKTGLNVFTNKNKKADSLTSASKNDSRQALWFTQLAFTWNGFNLEGGAGITKINYRFSSILPATAGRFEQKIEPVLAPRLAVSKRFNLNEAVAVLFASLSRGFSAPSTAEVFPSGGSVNTLLFSESGWNYELGIKAMLGKSVFVDLTSFIFHLQNAIVQRRTASGSDYFLNAGKTKQKGIELLTGFDIPTGKAINISARASYTLHSFHYDEFTQLNTSFSGNRFPGTPRHVASFSGEIRLKKTSLNLGYYYNSRTALNDANTEWAPSFHLLEIVMHQGVTINEKILVRLSAGINNALDEQYSLGPDINAFAGRYYNAAPARNYFVSFQTSLDFVAKKSRNF